MSDWLKGLWFIVGVLAWWALWITVLAAAQRGGLAGGFMLVAGLVAAFGPVALVAYDESRPWR
jgi:hypothetical protein